MYAININKFESYKYFMDDVVWMSSSVYLDGFFFLWKKNKKNCEKSLVLYALEILIIIIGWLYGNDLIRLVSSIFTLIIVLITNKIK